MSRSLNQVELIGNLTRDPESKVLPSGSQVTSFAIATNRSFTDSKGESKEETEFHRIVTWSKLADICGKFLYKGCKVYINGRLTNRKFIDSTGKEREVSEIVANDMIILSEKRMTDSLDE